MPFSNPATLSALIEGVDYFAWQCISGEKFPPTLGTGTYSSAGMRPSIACAANGASCTWPLIPALSPGRTSFNGVTITGFFWIGATWAPSVGDSISIDGGSSRITIAMNGSGAVTVYNGAGYTSAGTVPGSTWIPFIIDIAANGKTTYTINGVKTAQLNTVAPTTALQLKVNTPAEGGAQQLYVSALQATYN